MSNPNLISSYRVALEQGDCSNAYDFLAARNVQRDKSLILDLAYEEYCLNEEAGQKLSSEELGNRYPSFRHSIDRLIRVNEAFDEEITVAPPAWPEPGSRIANAQIIRQIGAGAMARVYLAHADHIDRIVAVKVSRDTTNEAKTLSRIDHRNIVRVLWAEPIDGFTAVMMSYDGKATLVDVLDLVRSDSKLPTRASSVIQAVVEAEPVDGVETAVELPDHMHSGSYVDAIASIGLDISRGLDYAHGEGIIHGDLKPSNVCITPAGTAKLLDFNLSIDRNYRTERAGGTFQYMAPEQLQHVFGLGDGKQSTAESSDIFSVGVLMWQLLTGELPWEMPEGKSPRETSPLLLKARETPPEIPTTIEDAKHRKLLGIALGCMSYDIAARPASAAALAERLEQFLFGKALNRRKAIAIAAAGITSVLGAAAYAGSRSDVPEEAPLEEPSGIRACKIPAYLSAITAIRSGDAIEANRLLDQANADAETRSDQLNIRYAQATAQRLNELYDESLSTLLLVTKEVQSDPLIEQLGYLYAASGKSLLLANMQYSRIVNSSMESTHNRAYLVMRASASTDVNGAYHVLANTPVMSNSLRSYHLRILLFAQTPDRMINAASRKTLRQYVDETVALANRTGSASGRLWYDLARCVRAAWSNGQEGFDLDEIRGYLSRATAADWPGNLIVSSEFPEFDGEDWFAKLQSQNLGAEVESEALALLFPPPVTPVLTDVL